MNRFSVKKPDFSGMETLLKGTLQSIAPRPEFVQQLRRRLQDTAIPSIRAVKVPTMEKSHTTILIAASVLSGLLVLLTNARAIISLVSALGALLYLRRQAQQKRGATLRPAL